MARDARRTLPTGSTFVRLLAALDHAAAPAARDTFAQRLSGWFDWTDAISLSSALDGPAAPAGFPASGLGEERECRRVRASLVRLVGGESAARPVRAADASRPRRAAGEPGAPAADDPDDFAPHRQRYVAGQQAMEAAIAPLRRRVRAALAGQSPELARLADLDAVMEHVVGAQERGLLSTVPGRLERHFERLRDAHADAPSDAAEPARPAPWLASFRQTLRELLLAELDLRLQPIEGLLEALRQSAPERQEQS